MRQRFALPGASVPFVLLVAGVASAQTTTPVSVTSGGAVGDLGSSRPTVSADGRYIAFYSDATNLVGGDGNSVRDVFRRDLVDGTTVRVSQAGGVGGEAKSSRPSMSADGRWVAFYSDSANLVPGDSNGVRDVFVWDADSGGITLLSRSSGGAIGNAESSRPSISGDGRFVAFYSDSTNLVAGDTNLVRDAFLHDRDADGDGIFDEPGAVQTSRVSVSSGGAQGNLASSIPVVSGDGRYVAFRSEATNLVAGDTNALRDVFVRDTLASTTVRVSVSTGGAQGLGDSSRPAISESGRFVAYYSDAANLVAGDNNQHCELDVFGQLVCTPARDCFVRDRDTDEDGIFDEPGAVKTVRVSVSSSGAQGDETSEDPHISRDGRYVAFWSLASNLVAGDTNNVEDVFLHDRDADGDGTFDEPGAISTVRVSVSTGGAQGLGASKRPAVTDDGRAVAFRTSGDNLSASDSNLADDVYVWEASPLPPSCSLTHTGFSTPSCSGAVTIDLSACLVEGTLVNFVSTNAPPLTAGLLGINVSTIPGGIPLLGAQVFLNPGNTLIVNGFTDAAGVGTVPVFVPPGTAGVPIAAQSFWFNTPGCPAPNLGTLCASDVVQTAIQ